MRVIIRADASAEIGGGHVMRCLALADSLKDNGAQIHFVCRDLGGNLCDAVASHGHQVLRIPGSISTPDVDAGETCKALGNAGHQSADWVIVDHYALDSRWESSLKNFSRRVMAIDDVANRAHDCDMLLDQNLSALEQNYRHLTPPGCKLLLGPEFALLRSEFSQNAAPRAKSPRQFHFGRSDHTGETFKTVEAFKSCLRPEWRVTIVTGFGCSRLEEVKAFCASHPESFSLHEQIDNMAELMRRCDVAIGGGGVSALERCASGLPALVIAVAENQVAACESLSAAGAIHFAGKAGDVSAAVISKSLLQMTDNPDYLLKISENGRRLVDGNGCQRVASAMRKVLDEQKK